MINFLSKNLSGSKNLKKDNDALYTKMRNLCDSYASGAKVRKLELCHSEGIIRIPLVRSWPTYVNNLKFLLIDHSEDKTIVQCDITKPMELSWHFHKQHETIEVTKGIMFAQDKFSEEKKYNVGDIVKFDKNVYHKARFENKGTILITWKPGLPVLEENFSEETLECLVY